MDADGKEESWNEEISRAKPQRRKAKDFGAVRPFDSKPAYPICSSFAPLRLCASQTKPWNGNNERITSSDWLRRPAIRNLAEEKGDIKPLCDELEGFHRLRFGSHRVIFEYEIIAGKRTVTCVFVGPGKWIHEVFQNRLME